MKSTKQVIQHIALWLGMLLIGNASLAQAATTATVTITATFVAPSCELDVPATVYLGSIKNGTQAYNPFSFQVNCRTPANTSVYAQAIEPLDAGSVDTVLMTGSGAKFWLRDEASDKSIALNGDSNEAFCAGENSRTCTLIPNTLVTPENARGETSTTIRLNIRYRA